MFAWLLGFLSGIVLYCFIKLLFGACRCEFNAQDRQVQYIFLGTGINHWHFCCVRKEAPFVRDDASR